MTFQHEICSTTPVIIINLSRIIKQAMTFYTILNNIIKISPPTGLLTRSHNRHHYIVPRSRLNTVVYSFDNSRRERNATKRARRHAARNATTTASQDAYMCRHCGRTYSSRIGILSHERACQKQRGRDT